MTLRFPEDGKGTRMIEDEQNHSDSVLSDSELSIEVVVGDSPILLQDTNHATMAPDLTERDPSVLSHTVNELVCEECGSIVNKHKVYWADSIWLFCPTCGLVVNDQKVDTMSREVFISWLRSSHQNISYSLLRNILDGLQVMTHSQVMKTYFLDSRQSETND